MNQSTAQPVRNSSAGQPQHAELDCLRSASRVSHDEDRAPTRRPAQIARWGPQGVHTCVMGTLLGPLGVHGRPDPPRWTWADHVRAIVRYCRKVCSVPVPGHRVAVRAGRMHRRSSEGLMLAVSLSRNLDGTPSPLGRRPEEYGQVSGGRSGAWMAVCKTVGLAYVGSNPTPATTCESGPCPGASPGSRAVLSCVILGHQRSGDADAPR